MGKHPFGAIIVPFVLVLSCLYQAACA